MANLRKFCVIGPKCGRNVGEYDRKWFESEDDAIDHAKSLMKDRQPGASPAFVVEVKQVVEVESRPITVRRPNTCDFA